MRTIDRHGSLAMSSPDGLSRFANRSLLRVVFGVVLAAVLFSTPFPAYASGDEVVSVKRTAVSESYIGDEYRWTFYETTDGRAIFDYELDKGSSKSGDELRLTDEWDSGIQLILDSPAAGGDKEIDAYIAQSAIWWYRYPDDISTDFKEGKEAYFGIKDDIIELVNSARAQAASFPSKEEYFASKLASCAYAQGEKMHAVLEGGAVYYETPQITILVDKSYGVDDIVPAVSGVVVVDQLDASNDSVFSEGRLAYGKSFRLRIPIGLLDAFLANPSLTVRRCRCTNPQTPLWRRW